MGVISSAELSVYSLYCAEPPRGEIERDIGVVGLENCTLRALGIFAGADSVLGSEAMGGDNEEGGWEGGEEEGEAGAMTRMPGECLEAKCLGRSVIGLVGRLNVHAGLVEGPRGDNCGELENCRCLAQMR